MILSRELRVGFTRKPGADKRTKVGKFKLSRGRGAPLEVLGTGRGTPAMQRGTPALPAACAPCWAYSRHPSLNPGLPSTGNPSPPPASNRGLSFGSQLTPTSSVKPPLPLLSARFCSPCSQSTRASPLRALITLDCSSCRRFHCISLLDSFRDCV